MNNSQYIGFSNRKQADAGHLLKLTFNTKYDSGSVKDAIMKTPWSIKSQDECIMSLGEDAFSAG
ncbi:hypothetical protein CHS0354_017221, partial [Potamilus streckersoni]